MPLVATCSPFHAQVCRPLPTNGIPCAAAWPLTGGATRTLACAIDGPKGVGKTATAQRRADTVVRLDEEPVRQLVLADPARVLAAPGVTLIDEWQHLPMAWDRVRRRVDEASDPAYLLTGSATPSAARDTHSGAGRILSLRLRPMALPERGGTAPTVTLAELLDGTAKITGSTAWGVADDAREICASGLPAIHALPPRRQRAQLDGSMRPTQVRPTSRPRPRRSPIATCSPRSGSSTRSRPGCRRAVSSPVSRWRPSISSLTRRWPRGCSTTRRRR